MTFTGERDPKELIPRKTLSQREIDALLSALPVDDPRQSPEADLVTYTNWAIEAVIKIQELGPAGFVYDAIWQAKGEIDESEDVKLEVLRKLAVQMMVVGQYNATRKTASTIQD